MPGPRISQPAFRTILFATDLSERAHEGFRIACSLASEEATRIVVLYVSEEIHVAEQPVGFDPEDGIVAIAGESLARRESIAERLRELYAPASPIEVDYWMREGNPAEEILYAADELGCDLIVMGTHGRSGLDRLILGSVAENVLRGARCPVLTVRSARSGSRRDRPAPRAAATIG